MDATHVLRVCGMKEGASYDPLSRLIYKEIAETSATEKRTRTTTIGNKRRHPAAMQSKLQAFIDNKRCSDLVRSVPGDEYIRKLKVCLDQFGLERTASQKMFHKAFLGATLAHVYGTNDFERHRTRILKENDMQDPSFEVLIVTPRRWGKTTSVAIFVAALLMSVADMWVSVFSTGQRASSSLLEQVYKLICYLPDGSSRILRRNQEQIYVKGIDSSDVRRLYSYPSSVQGERSLCPLVYAASVFI
ncbi:hypothetical protein CYMTET_55220 [Cymbomonas tetramitiformis]|uniref:Uncharacterized protein n=1 Tax=Cymbomonas tetramitiformis TaxID=36881 RepID=A0AAE0EQ31_9CHLO|nr:hypothetical protein CYMTET_55220 [Cymbomonas tetramitiformis]